MHHHVGAGERLPQGRGVADVPAAVVQLRPAVGGRVERARAIPITRATRPSAWSSGIRPNPNVPVGPVTATVRPLSPGWVQVSLGLSPNGTQSLISVAPVSLAVAVVLGAASLSGIAVLAHQEPAFGAAPSDTTVRPTLELADPATLDKIARTRVTAWLEMPTEGSERVSRSSPEVTVAVNA